MSLHDTGESTGIRGVIVPAVTPLDKYEKVNKTDVYKVVSHLLEGGVDALFVLGSTGEFALFDRQEKKEIIETFIGANDGRIPVIVNISEEGTGKSLTFYEEIKDFSMDAVVSTAPYYYQIRRDEDMYRHFMTIAEKIEVPLILYNIPQLTGNTVSAKVVDRCSKHPNIVGIKDSSSDVNFFSRILSLTENERFNVYQGNETLLLSSLLAGAAGGVNTLANIAPKTVKDLFIAWKQGNIDRAVELQKWLNEYKLLYQIRGSGIEVIKTVLALKSICSKYCRALFTPLNSEEEKKVQTMITNFGHKIV